MERKISHELVHCSSQVHRDSSYCFIYFTKHISNKCGRFHVKKKKKRSGDGCQPTSSFSGKLSALFSYFIFSIWVLIASVTLRKYFTSTNLTAFSKMKATLRPGLETPLVL